MLPAVLTGLDVAYGEGVAAAACVLFGHWTDATPADERTTLVHSVAPYVPGSFYERELPCLRAVLDLLTQPPELATIDGRPRLRSRSAAWG